MKCRIKRKDNSNYFLKNVSNNINHWVMIDEAKIFKNEKEAKNTISKYNLQKVEIEKIKSPK